VPLEHVLLSRLNWLDSRVKVYVDEEKRVREEAEEAAEAGPPNHHDDKVDSDQ